MVEIQIGSNERQGHRGRCGIFDVFVTAEWQIAKDNKMVEG